MHALSGAPAMSPDVTGVNSPPVISPMDPPHVVNVLSSNMGSIVAHRSLVCSSVPFAAASPLSFGSSMAQSSKLAPADSPVS
ncbi:hypothetical protein V6N13_033724 [Hibiscus sabdariffa]|uniref:Uncharacterized protein n=1 Tax=Hibiscus sabdariffa TaxID=183260 RepID=A0ABR2F9V9_9ROSI